MVQLNEGSYSFPIRDGIHCKIPIDESRSGLINALMVNRAETRGIQSGRQESVIGLGDVYLKIHHGISPYINDDTTIVPFNNMFWPQIKA